MKLYDVSLNRVMVTYSNGKWASQTILGIMMTTSIILSKTDVSISRSNQGMLNKINLLQKDIMLLTCVSLFQFHLNLYNGVRCNYFYASKKSNVE